MPADQNKDWIFECIRQCGELGATLRDIVAFVDYQNHAILTYAELALAINALYEEKSIERRGEYLLRRSLGELAEKNGNFLFSKMEFQAAVEKYFAGR